MKSGGVARLLRFAVSCTSVYFEAWLIRFDFFPVNAIAQEVTATIANIAKMNVAVLNSGTDGLDDAGVPDVPEESERTETVLGYLLATNISPLSES